MRMETKASWTLAAALLSVALPALALGQDETKGPSTAARAAQAPAEKSGSFIDNFYLEMAPEFSTGQFGAPLRSAILYLPATLGYDHEGIVASLTVPFEIERANVGVVFIGGRPVRVGGPKGGKLSAVAGMGDLLVDAGYYIFEEHDSLPSLLVGGELKFPTADDERGLGTGSYDELLRVTSTITLWGHLKASATLGYQWIGQPEDIPVSVLRYHNIVVFGVGAGYAFSKSNEVWARFDGNTRVTPGTSAYNLISAEWDHYFPDDDKLFISLGTGLSNAAPGLILTVGYQIWF